MQGKTNSTTVFDLSPALPQQHVSLEVDAGRQKEYGRWLLVGLVLVGALLFNAWQRDVAFKQGRALETLNRDRAAAQLRGGHLLIEVYSLSTPKTIDEIALNGLHLVAPGRQDTVFLPRVVASPQPPSSVVASR